MIKWNEDDIESLAGAFVKLLTKNPFLEKKQLIAKAQEQCFVPERRRHFTSVNNIPLLKDRILSLYRKAIQSEPPPPVIIEIPVERPVDYVELANRLDTPSLAALLTKRLMEGLGNLHLNGNGTQPSASARPATSPISLFAATASQETKRPPCVAYCCTEASSFNHIRDKVEKEKIPVELRWVDLDRRPPAIPMRANYVIFPKKATGGTGWDTAIAAKKQIYIVENNIEAGVQKILDIVSLNARVPACTQPPTQAARV